MKLSTGSSALDTFLDGGYESEVLTTIYGPSGTGKTTTCLLAAISGAQSGKVIFIDTEGGFSPERFQQLTPNSEVLLPNILIMKPLNFTEQKKAIDSIHENFPKNVSLVICDTITALYRVERSENNVGLNSELGKQVAKLLEIARKHQIPVLLTNQVYADFKDKESVKSVGGDIIKYNSKCLIELKIVENNKRLAILKKHRSIPMKEQHLEIKQEGLF